MFRLAAMLTLAAASALTAAQMCAKPGGERG
jgi:hypothetical protein